jgi:hypothetical protein
MKLSRYGKIAVMASFAAVLAIPAAAMAQEEESEGPNYLLVRTVNVKAGASAEWARLQKRLVTAATEAGNGQRDVWEVVRGRMDQFHIVSFHDDHSGFDAQGGDGQPPGADQITWARAISETIASRTNTESSLHKGLTIPRDEGVEPSLLTLRMFTLKIGQGEAFHTWLREELRPVLETGGATGVFFSHIGQGGDVNTCVVASHFANWAELDADGAFEHLSDEERDALFATFPDMVASHSMDMLAYRTDLSY